MPWKIGGNFEIVVTKCEANWSECVIAIANYLWCEMVSDVVDCLGKEGMIWILIMAITSTILLRVRYRRNVRTRNIILSKRILSKIGYKIHDLELKVNVLTYKMQYGMWPLPHQIYSLNPKKLQKIRMTLSNPGDQKSWINQVLLSPMKSSMCVPYQMFSPSETRLANFSDVKEKYHAHRHVEYNELLDCSSIGLSKSTSEQSVNSYAADTRNSRNTSTRESDYSKSDYSRLLQSFTLPHRNARLPFSVPSKIEQGRTSKTCSNTETEKRIMSSDVKCSLPYEEFTDTVRKCKSFLKELQCNNSHLHMSKCSSRTSKACTLKQNGNVSHDRVTTTEEETNGTRCAKGNTDNSGMTVSRGGETCHRQTANAMVNQASNDVATLEEFYATIRPYNIQSSQEALHEVKKRLRSLHNVLQTYQNGSRYSERERELERDGRAGDVTADQPVATTSSIGTTEREEQQQQTTNRRGVTDTDRNVRDIAQADPRRDGQRATDNCKDNRYLNHSGDSLSSLTGCSSSTAKTYRCASNVNARDDRARLRESSRHDCVDAHGSVERTNNDDPLAAFSTAKLSDCERSSRFYSFPTSQTSEDCTNCDESEYERETNTNTCGHEHVPDHARRSDTRTKINENVQGANDSSFGLEGRIPGTISERICCVLSPRSFKSKKVTAARNGLSARRLVKIFDTREEKHEGDAAAAATTVPQNDDRASENRSGNEPMIHHRGDDDPANDSDREEKPTALLLQEALHFKKILLTRRIDSSKERLRGRQGQGTSERSIDIADDDAGSRRERGETERRENRDEFPSMILDIKTEEPSPLDGSCDQADQHYVYLEMKQRRDPHVRSTKLRALARHEGGEGESQESHVSPKYLSITDFAIRDDRNDGDTRTDGNVLSSLKPPIYEKVISIMIPVDARNRDEVGVTAREQDARSLRTDDAVAAADDDLGANRPQENPRRRRSNRAVGDNIDDYVAGQRSATTRKLEDLVLERIRNIRDYMDTFLCNQNRAISKVRKALRYHGVSEETLALRCADEASHVTLHKRLIAISNRESCIDHQAVGFSSDSPDLLLKAWPNRPRSRDDIARYCSNVCLRRSPEMFALTAPTSSEFSDESDARIPDTTPTELKRKRIEAPSSSPVTLGCAFVHDENAKRTHKTTNLPDPTKRVAASTGREENAQTDERVTAETRKADTQSHKRRQTRADTEDLEASPVSMHSLLKGTETDVNVVGVVREKQHVPVISNDNLTSNTSLYFTNATASSAEMDDAFFGSTLNLEQSKHAITGARKETQQSQTVGEGGNLAEKFPDVKSSELSSNLEYSSLKTLVDSNLVSGESECSRTTLNGNDTRYDPVGTPTSPLSMLNVKRETLKTDDDSSSSVEQGNETFANVLAHSSAETERSRSTRGSSQIKAKSDVSLTADRRRNLNINLLPKRSLSFLRCHDSLAHIQRTLHQSHINIQYNGKDKFAENKLQFVNRSKSVVSSQRASSRSCIPISKNRLEPIGRMRHQTHARSPTRGPLTMSCREKAFGKSHPTNDENIAQRHNAPTNNRHLHVKEMPLDLMELDVQKNILVKDFERLNEVSEDNTTYRDGNGTSLGNSRFLPNDVKSLPVTDKEHPEKKSTNDGRLETRGKEEENATHKTVAVISIMADENLRKNYPANSFILKTENVCSATDFLRHKNKLWTITIERTEKEVTAKPSIIDTSTSVSEVTLKTN